MESIDNLREYALTAASVNATTRAVLAGYIDEIEREVEDLRDRDYRNGREDAEGAVEFADRLKASATNRADVTLWGVDYTALPLDAEGVPIHVGDVMERVYPYAIYDGGNVTEIRYTHHLNDDGAWEVGTSIVLDCDYKTPLRTDCYRHHHAPTVEDVLREFALACEDAGNAGPEVERIAAEYAAKLTLRGDE